VARKYFGNLVNRSAELRRGVEAVDLEGPAPGVAAAYDP
jgi:mitofusin